MPTERFLRLPAEKQGKILCAAEKEFCTYPMEDISINRIIKDAGISRGSFYTYFDDKQDVLKYLVRRLREREFAQAREYLLEHDFDVDSLMLRSIDHYVEVFRHFGICDREHDTAIKRGIMQFTEGRPEEDELSMEFCQWIWDHIDRDRYRVGDMDIFRDVCLHLMMLIFMTAARLLIFEDERERTMRRYEEMLDIMKKGLIRR